MEKKTFKLWIILIILILFLVSLCGCNEQSANGLNSEEQKFIGTWTTDSISDVVWNITFDSNGNYTEEYYYIGYETNTGRGTWGINDYKLTFTTIKHAYDSPTRYTFSWDYSFTDDGHFSLSSRYLGLYAYYFEKSEN